MGSMIWALTGRQFVRFNSGAYALREEDRLPDVDRRPSLVRDRPTAVSESISVTSCRP